MSPGKRKAIVFDLEDDKSKKKQRKTTNFQFQGEVKSNDSNSQEADDLLPLYLQPELMSLPQMLEILEQSNVTSSCLTGKSRTDVEKLFLQHISPKQQREYRENYTGKKLKLLQRKVSKKEPNSWSRISRGYPNFSGQNSKDFPYQEQSPKTEATTKPSVPTPKNSIPNVGERLKPAPASLINTQRKVIKLNASSPVKPEINNQKQILDEKSPKRVKISIGTDESPNKSSAKRAKVAWP